MKTILLKVLAWLIPQLLKLAKQRLEKVLEDHSQQPASLEEAKALTFQPLAHELIKTDRRGDLAAVDAALRQLHHDPATPHTYGIRIGERLADSAALADRAQPAQ